MNKQSWSEFSTCLFCDSEKIAVIGQYLGNRFVGKTVGINHKVYVTVFHCSKCGKTSEWTEVDINKIIDFNKRIGLGS